MASNIDTVPAESGTATRETTRPPTARPPARSRRAALTWAAIIAASLAVAALAVATLTGDDDTVRRPATRFDPQTEQYEQDAHLKGQAKTYGGANDVTDTQSEPAPTDSDPHDDEFVPGSRHMPVR